METCPEDVFKLAKSLMPSHFVKGDNSKALSEAGSYLANEANEICAQLNSGLFEGPQTEARMEARVIAIRQQLERLDHFEKFFAATQKKNIPALV